MSTKKDKFTLKDKFYMEIALDLAKSRHGLTGSNPSVGCVIVKNDKIISIGQTSFNGRPHSEFNAIKNSFEDLKGSKTGLPCIESAHEGKAASTVFRLEARVLLVQRGPPLSSFRSQPLAIQLVPTSHSE